MPGPVLPRHLCSWHKVYTSAPCPVPPGTKSWAPAMPVRSTPVCRLGSGETHRSCAYNHTRDTQAHRLHEKTHSTCVHNHMKTRNQRDRIVTDTDCYRLCVHRHTITQSYTYVFWIPGFPLPSPQKRGIDSHSAPRPSPLHAHNAGLDTTTQGFLESMDVWQLDSAMPLGYPTVMT